MRGFGTARLDTGTARLGEPARGCSQDRLRKSKSTTGRPKMSSAAGLWQDPRGPNAACTA